MDRQIIFSQIEDIKSHIAKEKTKQKWNNVLNLVSLCANILYWANPYYKDEELENTLYEVSEHLDIRMNGSTSCDSYSILVYDGFGLNNRGLIQIYLKALCPKYKVTYVTFRHRANKIPDILSILNQYQSKIVYLNKYKDSKVKQIQRLGSLVNANHIGKVFCYCLPEDVVCNTFMYALNGKAERYRINLTDHAYWLGSGCIDCCVEFREYGAAISNEYRGIEKEKIHIIPFYPIIPKKVSFQGFPFEKDNSQKVIFSGGLLYKTFGDNNRYYKLVDNILTKHKDILFWYAGSGNDTEMLKLIRKYPKRVFLTQERTDLFELLKNIDIYLSTYPFSGGLMYQYAAIAGKVPITLKKDATTNGFLKDQTKLNIEFDSEDELCKEIDRLLNDKEYYDKRSVQMKDAVLTEEQFNRNIENLVSGKGLSVELLLHIDTTEFRKASIDRMSADTYKQCFAMESFTILKYYPYLFIQGWKRKLKEKIG